MAKHPGQITLHKVLAESSFDKGKFSVLWRAAGPDVLLSQGCVGSDLYVLFEKEPEKALGVTSKLIEIGSDLKAFSNYWPSVLEVEILASRWRNFVSMLEFSEFTALLKGAHPELDEFLGRSHERMNTLKKFWIADNQTFQMLLDFALSVFFERTTPAQAKSLRRFIYGIDFKDKDVVNTWSNVNKFGSR
jgi:hypothetical protein